MSEAIQLDDYVDETDPSSDPPRIAGRKSRGGGGDMDDVLKRLGAVESAVAEIRVHVGGIAASIPHLSTKSDLNEIKAQVVGITAVIPNLASKEALSGIAAVIPTLATKSDLNEVKGQVNSIDAIIPHLASKADIHSLETKIIKWIITTVIATVTTASGIAFSIAKLVH